MDIEFNIFDKGKESYIIGDLLNMPYFFAGWNNTPHNNSYMYNLFKKTSLQYENNILGIYNKLRVDETEPIPNIEKIKLSVETFITNNNVDTLMCDDETLFVHLRSGDKGLIEDEFIDNIKKLQPNYSKIVILCGIHQNAERSHCFPSVDESINNLKNSLHKLNLNVKNMVIDTNEPDVHLCIMSKAKNLLLHKGGFSLLGALLFTGNNLYISNLFYAKNSNFLQHVKNPILL